MRVRPTIAWGLLAGLACVAAPARAQDQDPVAPFLDRNVATVRLEVEGRPETSPALLSLIDVKVHQPFTRAAYLTSIRQLQRLAPFAGVEVSISDTAAGLDVVFLATPFYPVDAMQFVDDAPLNLERRIKARYGGVPTDVDPDKVNDAVLEILHGEGYLRATATWEKVLRRDPFRGTVVFHVTAGPQARVGKVTIENRTKIPTPRLAEEVGAVQGLPYRPRAIQDALDGVVTRLKKDGYYSASADPPTAVEAAGDILDLTVAIDSGPLVVLRWARDSQPPSGNINDFVPIVQQNSVDDDLLNDSDTRIEQALKNQGYLDATVTHTSTLSTTGERVLTYRPIRGPRYRIERVEIPDGLALAKADLAKLLDLARGDVLDAARLYAGLQRIRNEYVHQGFYRVVVGAEYPPAGNRPPTNKEQRVILRPTVVEGPRGVVADVRIERDTAQVPEADLRSVIRGSEGQPYQAIQDDSEKYALEGLYLNLGYRQARVEITPTVSEDGHRITRVFHIVEGPLITVGDIRVVGWHDISEKAIREELTFGVGAPYGEGARLDSQRRINGMGVFSRVSVLEDPMLPGETSAHVVVRVVEAPDTTFGFGGGVEAGYKARSAPGNTYVDRLEFAPRGFGEASRRNLGGRNRAITFYARVSLRPKDVPGDPARDGKGYSFSEYRTALTYNERRAFGTDIDWSLSLTSEQSIRTSFNFVRNAVNADFVRRLTARTTANLRYSLDFTRLYDVRYTAAELATAILDIDRVFNQVRLSMLSLAVVTDHRDDALSPTHGTLSSIELDTALRGIGSEVGFSKMFLQGAMFRQVARSPRVILALRGEIGVAHGFPRPDPTNPGGTIEALPASQRFFAGGSTTVRGFQLDRLGVPAVLTAEGLPLGGNGLIVLNAELRTTVGKIFGRNFSTVQFADAGNVFARAGDIRLGRLRGSLGTGVRYDSPVGAIRLDFGFKLSRLVVGGARERGWEFHLSFGEAF